ncbi:MAG: hypothetical protein J0M18_03500 [Ignavibacteria bacterium]|nr:hypothetical protein [Ignavibacteria bacterium]
MFSLQNIKMNVVESASNGVVDKDTIFVFHQTDKCITANYSGGKIEKGFLVGTIDNDNLNFSYCQLQTDGVLDYGLSACKLSVGKDEKLIMREFFEWKSRPGEFGTNIFQEV